MPWIEPLIHILTIPGSYTFYIPRAGCPLSGREIDKMLTENRISHSRVGMFVDVEGDINMHVKKSQAAQAQALFDRYGVEVSNPYEGPSRTGRRTQRSRTPRTTVREPSSPFSVFGSVFGERCRYCGTIYRDGARTCDKCGAPR